MLCVVKMTKYVLKSNSVFSIIRAILVHGCFRLQTILHLIIQVIKTADGKSHSPALRPNTWIPLTLKSSVSVSDKMGSFVFALPKETDHTGCFPGQYVSVSVPGKLCPEL